MEMVRFLGLVLGYMNANNKVLHHALCQAKQIYLAILSVVILPSLKGSV